MRNYSKSKSIRSESSLCRRLDGVPSSELSLSDTPVAVVDRPVSELKPGLLPEPEVVVLVVDGDPEKDWLDRRVEPPSSKKIKKYCCSSRENYALVSMFMDYSVKKFRVKMFNIGSYKNLVFAKIFSQMATSQLPMSVLAAVLGTLVSSSCSALPPLHAPAPQKA